MSNPILNRRNFLLMQDEEFNIIDPMTINGTINKIIIMFICLLVGVGTNLYFLYTGNEGVSLALMVPGAFIGFILSVISMIKTSLAKYLACPYAICEGFVIGGISVFFESTYQGIVIQAIFSTFVVLATMLMLYKAKVIQYTKKFASVIMTALLSLIIIYLLEFIFSFFGGEIAMHIQAVTNSLIFNIIVVVIASMSLVSDFFFIETAAKSNVSKDFEWVCSIGLMVTLVWLYIEILSLLAKLRSRK